MTPMQARRCCPTTTQGSEFGSPTPRSRSPGRTGCTWTSGAPLSRTSSRPWPGPSGWAPGTSTSGSAPRRVMWCSPTPKATSSASSSRATASSPTVDRSGRWRATARSRSGTSGARRWGGRWSGTRTRRPRSVRRAAVRRSAGAVRRWRRRTGGTGRTSTSVRLSTGTTGRGRPSRHPRSDPHRHRRRRSRLGGDARS